MEPAVTGVDVVGDVRRGARALLPGFVQPNI